MGRSNMRETPKIRIYSRRDLMHMYRAPYLAGHEFMGEPEPEFLSLLERLPPHSRILDVGVGYGRNAAQAVIKGHSVVGVDVIPEALAAASAFIRRSIAGPRQRVADHGIAPGKWDLRRLDLERKRLAIGGKFGAVVTHYAMQDFSRKALRRTLIAMQEKTQAGGIFQGTFLIELERGEPRLRGAVPFEERSEAQIRSLFDSGQLISVRIKRVPRVSEKEMGRIIRRLFPASDWNIVKLHAESVAWQHPFESRQMSSGGTRGFNFTDDKLLKSASRGLVLKFEAQKK
jgi:SAM-dependent methyltransferase